MTNAEAPVLAAWAAVEQREDDWHQAEEAVALMVRAARQAVAALPNGGDAVLRAVDWVAVPAPTTAYRDPAAIVARAIGASAHTVLARIGVLQHTLLAEACRRVQAGESRVALVCGGEAKYRDLRARLQGEVATTALDEGAVPDTVLEPAADLVLRQEVHAGLRAPVGFYAILDSTERVAAGRSLDEHRRWLGELGASMSRVAAENPHAVRRDPREPASISDPSSDNPMLAFPYTKFMASSWNVDQAAALFICSARTAAELGFAPGDVVHPAGGAESNHLTSVAERADLASAAAMEEIGLAIRTITGIDPAMADLVELYSCFPVAVALAAKGLGMRSGRPVTVGGGMPFAGGPLNNFVLQATCRAADLLHEGAGDTALVTCVSGLFTKQAAALWTAHVPRRPYRGQDVTPAVAAREISRPIAVPVAERGRVAGYTVLFDAGEARRAVAVVDLDAGRRAVAANEDPTALTLLMDEEGVGRAAVVDGDRFRLA